MSNTEGTWCFWAPEMCDTRGEGAAFNAYAADAWSAGVTLWCFLYGEVPFFRCVLCWRENKAPQKMSDKSALPFRSHPPPRL